MRDRLAAVPWKARGRCMHRAVGPFGRTFLSLFGNVTVAPADPGRRTREIRFCVVVYIYLMSEEYTGAEAPTYPWGRGEIPPDALASPPDLPRFGVVPPGAGRPLTHGSLAPTGGGDFGSSRQGTSNRGGSAYDGAPRTQYVEPNSQATQSAERDWGLAPVRRSAAGTGPGLGTECSVERWDWGLSARPVAMIPEKNPRFDPSN
jgi:hypothetical protein